MRALDRLAGSSKAWVVGSAIIGVITLGAIGKLSMEEVVNVIKWLVIVLIGAQGLEDSAHKFGLPPPKDPAA